MSEKINGVQQDTEQILGKLGERIKKARLRRNISVRLLEEQAGIGRCTILRIERGVPTVSIGAYMAVLSALGLEKDLNRIALDEEGKWLEVANCDLKMECKDTEMDDLRCQIGISKGLEVPFWNFKLKSEK